MTIHWDKKPLKEVATIIGGSTPKTNINEFWGGDQFWVAPAELNGNKYISSTVKTITEQAVKKTHLTLLPTGTVLLSSRAPIGKVAITTVPMYCNQGFKNVVCGEYLHNEYVYYYLKHNINYLQSLGTGATFKEISKKVVEDILIPVPPINIQKEIASELDLLSSIIEKKNEQLKILDKLAESIFYEMFGDPVANEKGWKTNKMNAVAPQKAFTGNIPSVNGRYWLLNLDMVESQTGKILEKVLFAPSEIGNSISSFNDENILYSKLRPYLNKVVIPTEPGYCTSELVPLLPKKGVIERTFLTYLIRSKFFVEYINSRVAGAKMPRVSMSDFRDFDVILPPLEQQQLFSDKIAVIVKQKCLIEDSLKPAEDLLASRMDKYFSD